MNRTTFSLFLLYLGSAVAWYLAAPWFQSPVGLLVKAGLWLIPAAVYARVALGEGPLAAFALGPPYARGLPRAVGVGVLYLGAVVALGYAVGSPPTWSLPPTIPLALTVANAVIEEAAFRGFLLPHLARVLAFWKANLIVALAFVAVHVPSFLHAGAGAGILIMLASLLIFALALGDAAHRTRSILVPVIIHVVNNILAG